VPAHNGHAGISGSISFPTCLIRVCYSSHPSRGPPAALREHLSSCSKGQRRAVRTHWTKIGTWEYPCCPGSKHMSSPSRPTLRLPQTFCLSGPLSICDVLQFAVHCFLLGWLVVQIVFFSEDLPLELRVAPLISEFELISYLPLVFLFFFPSF